ncbi:V-type ATP synthase subunit I [Candidatus Gracilibacteria bacterium]|nr:V-type ATP synthase subunit I [Candidatus Gracilibacteria bacterium]
MAKVALQKIRVIGMKKHYKILMQELHRQGILHITQNLDFIKNSENEIVDHFGVFDLARIDFVIRFLCPFESGKSKLEGILSGGKLIMTEELAKEKLKTFSVDSESIISDCEKLRESWVKVKNELKKIPAKKNILKNLLTFNVDLQVDFSTNKTKTWIGKVALNQEHKFASELSRESNLLDINILGSDKRYSYFRLTVLKDISAKMEEIFNSFGVDVFDFSAEFSDFFGKMPVEIYAILEQQEVDLAGHIIKFKKKARRLAVHLDEMRILYDYNSWRKTKNDLQYKIFRSKHLFAFEAWVSKKIVKDLTKWIKNAFVGDVEIELIHKEKDEKVPVLLDNVVGVSSFEEITKMYSMPSSTDIDPTAIMSFFFMLFFGLCLSDVGYGLTLMLLSGIFLFFGKFPKTVKKSILMLFLCGGSATIGGIILGGYFGMTPAQAPEFLVGANGMFKGQLLDMTNSIGPQIFLYIVFGLGAFQILVGVIADFVRRIGNKDFEGAFADSAAWFFFLVSLVLLGVGDFIGLDPQFTTKLALIGAGILFLTQGRSQKNWFLKPIFGILGLYNVVNYFSDLLSYARVMALGLATGVVASVMNTIGIKFYEMISGASILIAIVVFVLFIIFGHLLNFALSLMGAFIHTGRLQFVEFFSKFYAGGGKAFIPFERVKKYLQFEVR